MGKSRRSIALLVMFFMLVSLVVSHTSVISADSGIQVQFNNGSTTTNSNTINAKFKVMNTGNSSVDISTLKLRYYYTIDAEKAQNFWCDHAAIVGNNYVGITNKVKGTFVKMEKPSSTADYYLEIGFSSDAGSIPAGGAIEVQTRVSRNDWSNYDQSNDFSYKSAGSYTDWDQVAAFVNGSLVFGKEAGGSTNPIDDPSISPTTATFDKYKPSDITISLTLNNNTFKGITGLTKGTEYTVSGNKVKILKSYLTGLSKGQKTLTFDFGVSSNPKLVLTIKDSTPSEDSLNISIGSVSGNKGDTVTVPISLANVRKVGKVGTCNFYLSYDSTLLEAVSIKAGDIVTNASTNFSSKISSGAISVVYLDNTIGDELVTEDGEFANITFKILGAAGKTAPVSFKTGGAFGNGDMSKINDVTYTDGSVTIKDGGTTSGLAITIGEVSGNKGDTVTVPISLANVAKAGNVGTGNFYLSYDSTLLEAISIKAGDIVTNASTNFSSRISSGAISVVYLDNTIGDELVTEDGVFANITFKILGAAGKTAPVSFKTGGAFGNGEMSKINDVKYNDGSVTIKDSGTTESLLAMIGTATGETGDTVTVPISLENVMEAGKIGAGHVYVTYDSTLLKPVSVTAGDIIGYKDNFNSAINNGSIDMGYLDSTMGDELITKDGVFANITFKILGKNAKSVDIKFTSEVEFGDSQWEKITDVEYTNGSVTIKQGGTTEGLDITIGTATGETGDTVRVPIALANVAEAGNIGTCNFYVGYDSTLLQAVSVEAGDIVTNASANLSSKISSGTISFVYLDNTIGDELITEDGVFAYVTFKILGEESKTTPVIFKTGGVFGDGDMAKVPVVNYIDGSVTIENGEIVPPTSPPPSSNDLLVNIGSEAGKVGDTVTIPVTLKNVAKVGNVGTCNFYVGYDPTLLEAVSVTAGGIITNPSANLSSKISSGTISFVFLDNTIGDELITEDGVMVNIKFKIIGKKSGTTPLTFKTGGAFGDGDMSKITAIELIDGSLKMN